MAKQRKSKMKEKDAFSMSAAATKIDKKER